MTVVEQSANYLDLIRSHLDRILDSGTASFGPSPSAMWMASLDTRTGRYPTDDRRPPHIPRRHYRAIDAPQGCSLYWDQPSLLAAYALSELTGSERYRRAADRYVADFLERCVAHNGVFLWGNHYYWDTFQGKTLKFHGEETPQPVDFAAERGDYAETRPIPPAWGALARVSPEAAERGLHAYVTNSLYDPDSGGFNRHADGKVGCAFLESGGILVEALAWLYARTGDVSLLDTADRIAGYSYRHRDPGTGLLENNPTGARWDKVTCTTEVGLWAGSLLRAAASCGARLSSWSARGGSRGGKERTAPPWIEMADAAVSAYLQYGYDTETRKYWGRLNLADSAPVRETRALEGDTALSLKHQPGVYADPWRPLFPAHDYPMPFAECCLELYALTGEERYRVACERWVKQVAESLPAREGRGGYAEHYGRSIHFLWRCGRMLGMEKSAALADRLAQEATRVLWDQAMFRSHPREHRYDAVDGVGYLLLSLIALETDSEPEMMGSGW
jgi:hypothetical protein